MKVQKHSIDPQERLQIGRHLLFVALLLTGIGLLIIFTSSSIPASQKFGDAFHFFRKQAVMAMVGMFSVYFIFKLPFRFYEKMVLPLLAISLGLLTLTLIPGIAHKANGAARWISIGGLTFQPAELAKLSMVFFLAKSLSRPHNDIKNFKGGVLPNLLVFGVFGFLLMLQPDFGSTILISLVTFVMLFTAGLPLRYVMGSCVVGVLGMALAIWKAPYRMARLTAFLDPWQDIQRGGFQIIQSYLGFQNGGLLGLGLGESRQKLYFLPEAHTDFILSVIGEELGLLGVLLVIGLFAYLTWLAYRITMLQENNFRKFLACGLSLLITLQASINMGVTMGLLPTKGIPLPFVSNGASSLVVFLIISGLLAKLGMEGEEIAKEKVA